MRVYLTGVWRGYKGAIVKRTAQQQQQARVLKRCTHTAQPGSNPPQRNVRCYHSPLSRYQQTLKIAHPPPPPSTQSTPSWYLPSNPLIHKYLPSSSQQPIDLEAGPSSSSPAPHLLRNTTLTSDADADAATATDGKTYDDKDPYSFAEFVMNEQQLEGFRSRKKGNKGKKLETYHRRQNDVRPPSCLGDPLLTIVSS